MNKQEARNTAAGMVRDALERLTEWGAVQDLRHFDNTKKEAARLLDFAQDALSYFEQHYDFQEPKTAIIYPEENSTIPDQQDYGVNIVQQDGERIALCRHVSRQDAINAAFAAVDDESEVTK